MKIRANEFRQGSGPGGFPTLHQIRKRDARVEKRKERSLISRAAAKKLIDEARNDPNFK